MTKPLDGKIALVTGGSRGIGRATALRLGRDGARVAVHYGQDEAAARATVAAITEAGGGAFALQADLADAAASVPALFAAFDREEAGLDILVNGAGVAEAPQLADAGSAALARLFAVNVAAVWEVTHHAVSRLRDDGRIINIASGVTRIVVPGLGAYAATKAAVETFSLYWAAELGARRITVNTVSPGNIATDMNFFLKTEEGRAAVLADQALKRIGEAADIADVVAFLAGPDSRWLTGQRLEASGGWKL
jgi:3-oxoacyl-[acyl-carrier protein] reductase